MQKNPPKVNETPRSLSAHPLQSLPWLGKLNLPPVESSNPTKLNITPDIWVRVCPQYIAEKSRIRHISWAENPTGHRSRLSNNKKGHL